jgi:hypothetical protein
MTATERSRNQHLHWLPDQLAPRVSENALRLCIDHLDLTDVIDHYQGIGGSLNDQLKALF